MKLLYIALCDLNQEICFGVNKKITDQLKTYKKEFHTYLITHRDWFLCVYHEDNLIQKKVLLTLEDIYNYIYLFIKENEIQCVYMRYRKTNYWCNEFLKRLKKSNIKVIIEFPTIPYDMETPDSVELEEDRLYRNKLKKYVDMSTNYNGLKSVFGITSIPINNGINLDNLPVKKENDHNDIILIAVATMLYWHGYDRLIRGLHNYYNSSKISRKVYLNLIGTGNQISNYQNLIKEYNLSEYIKLKGTKLGEELNEEFDIADIAIGVLGQFRKDADEASPIKTKEYCARGIPFVTGHNDLAFDDNLEFIHKVPNDNSDVDIHEIIQFYNNYKKKISSKEIRLYAEKNLTWDKILMPVIGYFN